VHELVGVVYVFSFQRSELLADDVLCN